MIILADVLPGYKISRVACKTVIKQANFLTDEFSRLASGLTGKENDSYEKTYDEMVDAATVRLAEAVGVDGIVCRILINCDVKEIKNDVTFMVTIQATVLEKIE